jgi:hypothetical protein
MKPVFRPTTPEDAPQLRDFFQRVFRNNAGPALLSPDHMHWKYWTPRPDWEGSRSYVVERDGNIVAHGAAWPLCLNAAGRLSGFYLYDWGADAESPGMGAAVFGRMARLVDLVWVAGGTDEATRTRAATGFRKVRPVFNYALPLHPARMELTRPSRNWKMLARLFRNLCWRLGAAAPAHGWETVLVSDPDQLPPASQNGFDSSKAFGHYYSQCPAARVHWYEVRKNGELAGFFTLLKVPGQARLAEAAVLRPDPDAWRNIAALAVRTALEWDGADEIAVLTSLDEFRAGLEAAGFHLRGQEDAMVYDPGNKLGDARFHFQLLHGDLAFLHQGQPAYLC